MEARRQDLLTSIGLLVLRVGTAGYMLTHGWQKLQMLRAGGAEQFGSHMGMSPTTSLLLVVMAEFVCALLVLVGLATRLASIPVAFTMAVAAFVAHANDPWTMGKAYELFASGATKFPVSKQPALMYLVVFLALVFTGAGRFSLDGVLWPRLRRRKAAAPDAA